RGKAVNDDDHVLRWMALEPQKTEAEPILRIDIVSGRLGVGHAVQCKKGNIRAHRRLQWRSRERRFTRTFHALRIEGGRLWRACAQTTLQSGRRLLLDDRRRRFR